VTDDWAVRDREDHAAFIEGPVLKIMSVVHLQVEVNLSLHLFFLCYQEGD
jgi:hypothetical protein